jgi:uncharacterized repeat protein (TIGR01451 family)
MTFVVTATETITNNDYGVQADGGVSTIGDWVIVTEIVDTIIPGQGNGPQILPGGSATTQQNKDFSVYLFNHRHVPPVYEIYLESLTTSGLIYRICPPTTAGNPVITDQNGNGLFNCLVSTAIPPGNYRLFSTEAGLTTVIAQFEIVTVLPGEAPFIQIQGGNTLVANSQVEITLSNHAIADEDFRLYFDDGISETEITNGPVAAEPAPTLLWTVPLSAASACPPFGSPCRIFSRSENPTAPDPYAETEIYVVAPGLTITKTAPATVNAGDPITYTLTVANSGAATATNLLITDTLPAGATYLSGGSRTGEVISWSVPSLPVSATVQVSFVVTADQTVVNSDYGVRADGGLIALGGEPVETIVLPDESGLLRRVFLPLIVKP